MEEKLHYLGYRLKFFFWFGHISGKGSQISILVLRGLAVSFPRISQVFPWEGRRYSSSEWFANRTISYLALSDRRTWTCIFRQLRHDNAHYTRTAVLLHKWFRHPTMVAITSTRRYTHVSNLRPRQVSVGAIRVSQAQLPTSPAGHAPCFILVKQVKVRFHHFL